MEGSTEGRMEGRRRKREGGKERQGKWGREELKGGTDPIIHIGVCRPMSLLTGKDLQVDRT